MPQKKKQGLDESSEQLDQSNVTRIRKLIDDFEVPDSSFDENFDSENMSEDENSNDSLDLFEREDKKEDKKVLQNRSEDENSNDSLDLFDEREDKKEDKKVLQNRIRIDDKNDFYYCDICKKYFGDNNQLKVHKCCSPTKKVQNSSVETKVLGGEKTPSKVKETPPESAPLDDLYLLDIPQSLKDEVSDAKRCRVCSMNTAIDKTQPWTLKELLIHKKTFEHITQPPVSQHDESSISDKCEILFFNQDFKQMGQKKNGTSFFFTRKKHLMRKN